MRLSFPLFSFETPPIDSYLVLAPAELPMAELFISRRYYARFRCCAGVYSAQKRFCGGRAVREAPAGAR